MPNSGDSVSSSVESRAGQGGHAKKRSGGAGVDRYGPLGPLADDDLGWGRSMASANGNGNLLGSGNGNGNGLRNGNGNPFTGRKL